MMLTIYTVSVTNFIGKTLKLQKVQRDVLFTINGYLVLMLSTLVLYYKGKKTNISKCVSNAINIQHPAEAIPKLELRLDSKIINIHA